MLPVVNVARAAASRLSLTLVLVTHAQHIEQGIVPGLQHTGVTVAALPRWVTPIRSPDVTRDHEYRVTCACVRTTLDQRCHEAPLIVLHNTFAIEGHVLARHLAIPSLALQSFLPLVSPMPGGFMERLGEAGIDMGSFTLEHVRAWAWRLFLRYMWCDVRDVHDV